MLIIHEEENWQPVIHYILLFAHGPIRAQKGALRNGSRPNRDEALTRLTINC